MARKPRATKQEDRKGPKSRTLAILGVIALAFCRSAGTETAREIIQRLFPPPPPKEEGQKPQYQTLRFQEMPSGDPAREDYDITITRADKTTESSKMWLPTTYVNSFLYPYSGGKKLRADDVQISFQPYQSGTAFSLGLSRDELFQNWKELVGSEIDLNEFNVTNIEIMPSKKPGTKGDSQKKA